MPVVSTRLSLLVALGAIAACSSKDATSDAAQPGAAAEAPAATAAEPTANDISNYQLDMDKMRRYTGAIRGFSSLSSSDSAEGPRYVSAHANEDDPISSAPQCAA